MAGLSRLVQQLGIQKGRRITVIACVLILMIWFCVSIIVAMNQNENIIDYIMNATEHFNMTGYINHTTNGSYSV